ncbi:unnamed protein product, partial [Ixodes hexagonus]
MSTQHRHLLAASCLYLVKRTEEKKKEGWHGQWCWESLEMEGRREGGGGRFVLTTLCTARLGTELRLWLSFVVDSPPR